MQASLSRSVIGPARQAGGGSKQIADYALEECQVQCHAWRTYQPVQCDRCTLWTYGL